MAGPLAATRSKLDPSYLPPSAEGHLSSGSDGGFPVFDHEPFDFDVDEKLTLGEKCMMGDPTQSGCVSAAINCGKFKLLCFV